MSKHDQWQFRIRHILEALERIFLYTNDMTIEAFVQDRMVRDAVERNFEIIGEAVKHIPSDVREHYPDIPWCKMAAMCNFIVHQYDEVEEIALWNTIQKDLPSLKIHIQILKDGDLH